MNDLGNTDIDRGHRRSGIPVENRRIIDAISAKIDDLPTLPGIAIKLLEAVRQKEPDIPRISRIISSDVVLTTKILKLANSPFYGFASKITTIERAIAMLGISTVKSLALSFSVTTAFYKKSDNGINHAQFWKDSVVSAVSTKLLAEKIRPRLSADAFFMGLLKDMGALTMAYSLPEEYARVAAAVGGGRNQFEAENEIIAFNHRELGEYLAVSWGMPEEFCLPIGCHHCPEKMAGSGSSEMLLRARMLHLACLFTEMLNASDMTLLLGSIQQLAKDYEFADRFDCAKLAEEIHEQTREILPIFDIQFKDKRDLSKLLDKAKSELAYLSMELVNTLVQKGKEVEFFRRQAATDDMTCVRNYKGFCEDLEREISRSQRYGTPLTILLGDIDHFKKINDTFGHLAGDEALKTIAQSLKEALRLSDYIARYGGEEFAVILPETDLDDAMLVAERLRIKIAGRTISFQESRFRLTMSFGAASMPMGKPCTKDALIQMADNALYRAKEAGRNCCVASS